MAQNLDCACYSTSLFNAIEPYKAIITNTFENVKVSSFGFKHHEHDVGLLYLLSLEGYLTDDTFVKDSIHVYFSPGELDDTDFSDKLYHYIHLPSEFGVKNPSFMDLYLQECSIASDGSGTNMTNILKGDAKFREKYSYTMPITLVINICNMHYMTLFTFSDNTQIVIDDGIIKNVNDYTVHSKGLNIVAMVQPTSEEFNDSNVASMIVELCNARNYANVEQKHIISFNHTTRKIKITVRNLRKFIY